MCVRGCVPSGGEILVCSGDNDETGAALAVLHLPCPLASSDFDITSTFDTDILAELLLFLPMPDNQEVPL